jgi:Putative auto-transporter adhesin, head GIN domain
MQPYQEVGRAFFRGKHLKTTNSDIKFSGLGDVSMYAASSLNAVSSSSGEIRYSGNARISSTKNGRRLSRI